MCGKETCNPARRCGLGCEFCPPETHNCIDNFCSPKIECSDNADCPRYSSWESVGLLKNGEKKHVKANNLMFYWKPCMTNYISEHNLIWNRIIMEVTT